MESIIKAYDIKKWVQREESRTDILKGVSIEIKPAESVCIIGASGAGKSTFLHILGTLDRCSSGQLEVLGKNVNSLSSSELAEFRNKKMGFVFQFHHLFPELNTVENVMLPSLIAGEPKDFAKKRAQQLLETLGLSERMNHYSNQLSGGELQRASIARALIRRPEILFADEPTGNLDSANALLIQDLFFQMKKEYNLSLVVVTHDLQFAQKFERCHRLVDGQWSSFGKF